MLNVTDKNVLVLGLDARGLAAAELLIRHGARVAAMDTALHPAGSAQLETLRAGRAELFLGESSVPDRDFEFAVLSPEMPLASPLLQGVLRRRVPIIGELELGYRQAQCLSLAVAGTNGKSTTAELIARVLANAHRQAVIVGDSDRPACAIQPQARDLDFMIFQADARQLERTEYFRPAVAVLLNLAPVPAEVYPSREQYIRACASLFRNQQTFDWAIIQSEALAHLRELDLPVPAKVITFSATDSTADLHLDRGLLISRLNNWSGPLLDMDHCQLRGPHNAENLMAALAVGHALRIPLDSMTEPLKTFPAGAHRCQLVAEINGVQFINDAKAANLDALHKALLAARSVPAGPANIFLIAGGRDEALDFHDLGPTLSRRAKRAFLLGPAAEKIRAAWSLFTPCTVASSLVEALREAVQSAGSGDVVLFSPACSSLDEFRSYQQAGERFCAAVKSITRGADGGDPNIHGKTVAI